MFVCPLQTFRQLELELLALWAMYALLTAVVVNRPWSVLGKASAFVHHCSTFSNRPDNAVWINTFSLHLMLAIILVY